MSVQEQVQDLIKQVPARRWLEYGRTFGMPTQEAMSDAVVAMVVVLTEEHRKRHGSASVEKYLDLGLTELSDELERVLAAPAEGDEATFQDGAAGGSVGRDLDADGPGVGVRAEPGTDLPGDAHPAE